MTTYIDNLTQFRMENPDIIQMSPLNPISQVEIPYLHSVLSSLVELDRSYRSRTLWNHSTIVKEFLIAIRKAQMEIRNIPGASIYACLDGGKVSHSYRDSGTSTKIVFSKAGRFKTKRDGVGHVSGGCDEGGYINIYTAVGDREARHKLGITHSNFKKVWEKRL